MVALIAAGCGLLGSVLGSAATAWASKAGADKSAEAVSEQTHDQAANEHAHWLRQQRLSACEGFLDAWDECTRMRKELTRPMDTDRHDTLRAELSRSASHMLERARRISILGPDEVTQAAESISTATMENIDKEDKFGEYLQSAVATLREEQTHMSEIAPNLQLDQLNEALRHANDLERLQELFSLEDLERIVGDAETSIAGTEEWIRRAASFGELGEEINDRGSRFLEEFKRNIRVTEENREVFVRTVRNSIANPS